MVKQKKAGSEQLLVPLEALDDQALRDLGDGDELDHPPIIITDGSANIDLSSVQYTQISSVYTSFGLHLDKIECLHAAHGNGSNICYTVRPGELCRVVFHCSRPSFPVESFTIQGGLTTSPIIIFNHDEFIRNTGAPGNRHVHSNANRKIVALEIIRIRGGGLPEERVHVCPLIPPSGRVEYKVWDPHVLPHDHSHII